MSGIADLMDEETLKVMGPMMGLTPEKIAQMKAVAEDAERKERAKTLMLRRIYKFIQKLDPAKYEEVLADEKKGKEGN